MAFAFASFNGAKKEIADANSKNNITNNRLKHSNKNRNDYYFIPKTTALLLPFKNRLTTKNNLTSFSTSADSDAGQKQGNLTLPFLINPKDNVLTSTPASEAANKDKEQQRKLEELQCIRERYTTGIELIKILYEKILDLEHHFATLNLQKDLSRLTNPNDYPQFKEAQMVIRKKQRRNVGVELPMMLESNPYIAVTYALTGILVANMGNNEKKEKLDKLACIMDYTIRMRTDLNGIGYENDALRDANLMLKNDCERLFEDYLRAIEYSYSLSDTRQQDKWEVIEERMDDYSKKNKQSILSDSTFIEQKIIQKGIVNFQFSIDRLLEFIGKYNQFTSSGTQNYKKCAKMLDNFAQPPCAVELPIQFGELKSEIEQSVLLFENAYRMPELKGFKRKMLMYCTK
jgi:hypothetical protein